MMGLDSIICCSIQECCPLTAARNCRISFVLSVLPAPLSPLKMLTKCCNYYNDIGFLNSTFIYSPHICHSVTLKVLQQSVFCGKVCGTLFEYETYFFYKAPCNGLQGAVIKNHCWNPNAHSSCIGCIKHVTLGLLKSNDCDGFYLMITHWSFWPLIIR